MPSPNPAYGQLFAFGIDPVDGGLPTDQPSDWPTLDEVQAYKQAVRGEVSMRASIRSNSQQTRFFPTNHRRNCWKSRSNIA